MPGARRLIRPDSPGKVMIRIMTESGPLPGRWNRSAIMDERVIQSWRLDRVICRCGSAITGPDMIDWITGGPMVYHGVFSCVRRSILASRSILMHGR
jgi:hypothetical protein